MVRPGSGSGPFFVLRRNSMEKDKDSVKGKKAGDAKRIEPEAVIRLSEPATIPEIIPQTLADDDGDAELQAPELERSLDRAKENLLAYIGERSPNFNRELVQKAIDFTMLAHKNQFRRSGMPYAEHPF